MSEKIYYCRRMLKSSAQRCGNRLVPDGTGKFYWCYASRVDPITGHQGCSTHWTADVVEAWEKMKQGEPDAQSHS